MFENAKTGDRLEIHHKFDKKPVKAYVSQIQDILSESRFIAYSPMEYGNVVRLPNGDECDIIAYTEKGIIKTTAAIMRNVVKDGVFFVVFKIIGEGEKIQRRDFFRFDCVLDFKFGVIEEAELTEENINRIVANCNLQGLLKDIGGGGIRFVSNDDIEEKVDVCCVIDLDGEVILPIGTVLHKMSFPKSNYTFQYRVQFHGIPQYEQEKIVQYIFNEQRKRLRRTRD